MGNFAHNPKGELPLGKLLGLGLAPDPARIAVEAGKNPRRFAGSKTDSGKVRVARRTTGPVPPLATTGHIPRFGVTWQQRRKHWMADLRALLHGPWPAKLPRKMRFHDSWRPRRHRALCFSFSSLAHVLFIALPLPLWLAAYAPENLSRTSDLELSWAGPVQYLPAIHPSPPKPAEPKRAETKHEPAPAPLPKAADPAPPRVERASRQTIMTAPAQPNHPRQMLLQPAAAPEAPKILPPLPNIVEWGAAAQPARPRVHINREALARLQPKTHTRRSVVEEAAPALPNQESRFGELSISAKAPSIARPRMPVPAASVPVTVQRRDLGDAAAPDVGPGISSNSNPGRNIIALSANPAPPPPSLDVPLGNLAARVSVSPLGPTPGPDTGAIGATGKNPSGAGETGVGGNGGGSTNGSNGNGSSGGPPEIFISRGDPGKTSNVVGPAGSSAASSGSGLAPPGPSAPAAKAPPRLSNRDLALGTGRGGLTAPPPPASGALGGFTPTRPEEAVLRQKRVYSVAVNMPNLTSVTGSWILRFAELDTGDKQVARAAVGELTAPEAISKVDPKYPPALIEARIEGDVVLYAIIRKDGTVDSVQILKSLEPELDRNAADALARWQFWPAVRSGSPVDIEAVVTIPFRAFAPK